MMNDKKHMPILNIRKSVFSLNSETLFLNVLERPAIIENSDAFKNSMLEVSIGFKDHYVTTKINIEMQNM